MTTALEIVVSGKDASLNVWSPDANPATADQGKATSCGGWKV